MGARFEVVAGAKRHGGDLGSCAAPVVAPVGGAIAFKFLHSGAGASPLARLGIAVDDEVRAKAEFVAMDPLVWSADGRSLAAAVALPNEGADGADGTAALRQDATDFVARADDKERVRGHWHVWRDGVLSDEYDAIEQVTWSPRGHQLAWAAARADLKWRAVVDGVASGPAFDAIGPLHFTADADNLFFGALDGRKIVRVTVAIATRR